MHHNLVDIYFQAKTPSSTKIVTKTKTVPKNAEKSKTQLITRKRRN